MRKKSAIRLVVVLLFALAGAVMMGSVAQPTLSFIYERLENIATPERVGLDDPATPADDAVIEDAEAEETSAGPLTLAIDVQGEAPENEPAVASAPVA